MDASAKEGAWLETVDSEIHELQGSCSLGRADVNTIVIDSPKVSRQHAVIHLQNMGEFWLIDFGSSNGTFVNKRRVQQPVRLNDNDQISIGDRVFTFRQDVAPLEYRRMAAQQTVREIENIPCWLLVADIRNFTTLSRNLHSEGLDLLIGGWIAACKEIIEQHHGTINKYLGDGFLAYWTENAIRPEEMAAILSAFKELQKKNAPEFRVVVHFGQVSIGGVASMGEGSLMGKEVNLIFRLEKLAGSLGESCGLSEKAQAKLGDLMPARRLGDYELKGFDGKSAFFAA